MTNSEIIKSIKEHVRFLRNFHLNHDRKFAFGLFYDVMCWTAEEVFTDEVWAKLFGVVEEIEDGKYDYSILPLKRRFTDLGLQVMPYREE